MAVSDICHTFVELNKQTMKTLNYYLFDTKIGRVLVFTTLIISALTSILGIMALAVFLS